MICNRRYCLIVALLLLGVISGHAAISLKGTRPNIIFFLGDDQNITDQSVYGNTNVPTPTTQAFSEEGLVFERAFAPQAICAPSRSALYTGRYPVRNGCFINHTDIRPRIRTLPQYLAPLGYNIILAGKSHVDPDSQFTWTHWWDSAAPSEGRPHGWIPISAIRSFLQDPGSKPFCMIITSHYPHGPYITNKEYSVNGVVFTPGSPQYVPYHASIAEKEAELAAVLNAVKNNGLANDTIVFVSDDHGISGKFTCYDRGLNVAYMVRWPGKITPGRTSALTSFVDFVPTVIELAGGTAPATLCGKSLIPVLEGRDEVLHEYVYGAGVMQGIIERKVFPSRSIHDGRYHYIWNFNSLERINREGITDYFHVHGAEFFPNIPEEELYDTLADHLERNNLAGQAEFAAIQAKLKQQLFSWMADQSDYLEENISSPFLWVSRNRLDQSSPNDPVPPQYVGSLNGLMVMPHNITNPNLGCELGTLDFNASQVPSPKHNATNATLDESTPFVTSTSLPGYSGPPVYRGFQKEGTSHWSATPLDGGGLRVRWNKDQGVAGEKTSGLFLFNKADFRGTYRYKPVVAFSDAATVQGTLSAFGAVGAGNPLRNATVRIVFKDSAGYHISAALSFTSGQTFSRVFQNMNYSTYNPFVNTDTTAGTIGGGSVPTFVDIQFAGFRLDAVRGSDLSGVNFGMTEFLIDAKSPYIAWVYEHNLFGSKGFDEDGDGFSNLYEFAMGGNPADPGDYGYIPAFDVQMIGGSGVPVYTHAKRLGAAGELAYALQGRTNLVDGSWGPVDSSVTTTNLDPDYENVTHQIGPAFDARFLRLKITAQ